MGWAGSKKAVLRSTGREISPAPPSKARAVPAFAARASWISSMSLASYARFGTKAVTTCGSAMRGP
jgi:hypothetical protein